MVTDGDWRWLTVTDSDWQWLTVADSGWQWLTMSYSDWQWLTVNDGDWLWLKVTDGDCWWLMVTDGDWRWHTVTYRHWWLVSVTDGDLPWSTRVWRSDQKSIVRTREGQLKAVKVFTNNFSIVIPHGTGSRVQVKNKTIPPLGATLYWKVVSEFWFGHPKYHFWYPQND